MNNQSEKPVVTTTKDKLIDDACDDLILSTDKRNKSQQNIFVSEIKETISSKNKDGLLILFYNELHYGSYE